MESKFILTIFNSILSQFRCVFLLIFVLSLSLKSVAQTNWTGNSNNDWFDPGNWSDGIPDINDDVIIPSSANNPEISGTLANAKSIEIEEMAILNITDSGSLNIDTTSLQYSLFNLGTLNNSGVITIGNTVGGDFGIYLGIFQVTEKPGIINNFSGASITINNTNIYGLWLANASANQFTNQGTVTIGNNASGTHGLYIENGVFDNEAGGLITIMNNTNNYIFTSSNGTLNNEGDIDLGDVTGMASNSSNGITNYGSMSNSFDGTIDITSYTNLGIFNDSQGSPAVFNNSGTVNIDGNLAGNYGLRTRNPSSVFNNLESGILEISDIAVVGLSAGEGNAGLDETSEFNNSGTVTILGWPGNTGTGVTATVGTVNNNGGQIAVYECNIGFSTSSGGTINNSASLVFDTSSSGTFDEIFRGPENGFVNNAGGSVMGNGQIYLFGPFINNGGSFSPGDLSSDYGIIEFRNDIDLTNSTINLDINGSSTAGTDYDKIEANAFLAENVSIGGTLNLNITYTPSVSLEYITIFEAGTEIIGEFSTVNGLPTSEWTLLYNFPSEGNISLEYGAINSVQSGPFNDPNTWAEGIVPDVNNPAIIEDGHVVTLGMNETFEIARLQLDPTASLIIPNSSEIDINNAVGTAVINDGTIELEGSIVINNSQSVGVDNDGTINLNGISSNPGLIDITNTTDTAIKNEGDISIGDNALINIDNANIGIENTNVFTVALEGQLTVDFTDESGVVTTTGSTFTNNGQTLIGRDPTATNSVGLYGIDHLGYILNSASGLIEVAGATDTQILLPPSSTTTRFTIDDGSVDNFGEMNIFGTQTAAINQGDDPSAVKGKYKHKIKKRPPPNPGRDGFSVDGPSYSNEPLSLLRGSGIIESDVTFLNGGVISPGVIDGNENIIVFDGDEDFQNVNLKIDINGSTLKGTDYDLVTLVGTATIGGDLDLTFNYVPQIGDVITFFEADNIIGSFNEPSLPMDWNLRYNYPNAGSISLEFGVPLSTDETSLDNLKIYHDSEQEQIVIFGNLAAKTQTELYDIAGRKVLNTELNQNSNYNTINTTELASGVYIIELISVLNGKISQKLIID